MLSGCTFVTSHRWQRRRRRRCGCGCDFVVRARHYRVLLLLCRKCSRPITLNCFGSHFKRLPSLCGTCVFSGTCGTRMGAPIHAHVREKQSPMLPVSVWQEAQSKPACVHTRKLSRAQAHADVRHERHERYVPRVSVFVCVCSLSLFGCLAVWLFVLLLA